MLIHFAGGPSDDPVSLLIDAGGPGVPVMLHFGAGLGPGARLAPGPAARWGGRLNAPPRPSLLPTEGRGAFEHPALSVVAPGAAFPDLRLTGVDADADRARFTLADAETGVAVVLNLAIDPVTGVVVSRATLTAGPAPADLRWLASACWRLPEQAGELLALSGAWADEFRVDRLPCPPGLFGRDSRRGRSSHEAFPGVIVGETGFGHDRGQVWGATLGWSGNHRWFVEPLEAGGRQLQLGGLLGPGEIALSPGEAFETPPAYTGFSSRGLNGLRARLHGFVRRRLVPPQVAARPRPVTLNTWEALYFDQTTAKVVALAERAAALGVERFVLDDGWFRGRRDDTRALGDWSPDPLKHPDGLGPVAARVVALGMQFGLWVEPEMVNVDSDLFRAHPDWVLSDAGRPQATGRNQLALDLTRPDVIQHVFGVLDGLLHELPIACLKWDMNRPLTDVARTVDGRDQPAGHAYVAALHELFDWLRAAHPDVEIEACASGGGRADWGMLARTHRVWTSDNLDPLDRLRIEAGAGLFLPPELLGSHVGAATAHVTGRRTGVNFRAHVAMFSGFGVEADPGAMTGADHAALVEHIAAHKRLRPLLQGGLDLRLDADADHVARMTLSEDRDHALLGLYRTGSRGGAPVVVRPTGLDPAGIYALRLLRPVDRSVVSRIADPDRWLAGEVEVNGAMLGGAGLRFQLPRPLTSLLIELTRR